MTLQKPWLASYPKGVLPQLDYSGYGSLLDLIDQAFSRFANQPASWCMGKQHAYSEVDHASMQIASYFQSLGLSKGARIGIMLPNIPQYSVTLYAILRAGYVVVSINPMYTPRELQTQLSDSGAEVIVILEHFAKTLQDAMEIADSKYKVLPLRQVVLSSIGEMLGWKGPWVDRFIRTFKKKVPPFQLPAHLKTSTFSEALQSGAKLPYQKPALDLNSIALLQLIKALSNCPSCVNAIDRLQ